MALRILLGARALCTQHASRVLGACHPIGKRLYASDGTRDGDGDKTKEKDDARKRSDVEWRARLTPLEYSVLRRGGTEPPFTNKYDTVYPTEGHFACKGCGNPLYSWESKFSSGCGWPAFDKAYEGTVRTRVDSSHGMTRWEILCAECDGHLGHVFTGEGYTPTSQRHCVNSVSIEHREDSVDRPETPFDFAAYPNGKDVN
eukprot:m.66246 g.66246  ORF g.66246 m.66246 type:complete len:201 (+) comp8347_c0_seq2:1614-2216(+)